MDTLQTAGAAVAGFVASSYLLDKLNLSQTKQGWGRIAGKAAAAVAIGYGMNMAKLPKSLALGVTLGGLTSAGLDIYNRYKTPGAAGVAGYGIDGVGLYPSNAQGISGLGDIAPGTMIRLPDGRTYVTE